MLLFLKQSFLKLGSILSNMQGCLIHNLLYVARWNNHAYHFLISLISYYLQFNSKMQDIVKAIPEHSKIIADFQYKMALQTQNLELDLELVIKAIEYVTNSKEDGFFLVKIHPQQKQPIGSLLLTFENSKSWWIESVYVVPEERRKGIFTSIFKKSIEIAKSEEVKSVKLYAENDNERAKQTYVKLGMYCNGQKFYGYDFAYGDNAELLRFESKISEQIKFQQGLKMQEKEKVLGSLSQVLQRKAEQQNKVLLCYKMEQVMGYCEYFYEFSDWRFGIIIYVSCLYLKPGHQKLLTQQILKHLFQNCKLKVGAIRFYLKNEKDTKIMEICPSAHLLHYDIMAIDL